MIHPNHTPSGYRYNPSWRRRAPIPWRLFRVSGSLIALGWLAGWLLVRVLAS